nr:MotA/TolQ/ExbB proton channel family protein [Salirhabdus salicampi]
MSNYSIDFVTKSVMSSIHRIQSSTSTVILIGVLGTFIGLISALYGIDVSGTEIQSSIQNVLNGIYIAFFTSVFGIMASLILSFVQKHWDAEHVMLRITLKVENLLHPYDQHTWENRMITSLEDVKNAIQDMHGSLRELDHFSDTMERASENLNEYNIKFEESSETLQSIFHNMETVGENFNKRMDSLNERFDQLNHYQEEQQHVLRAIEKGSSDLYRDVANYVQQANTHLESIADNSTKQSEHTKSFYDDSMRELKQVVQSMSLIEEKNKDYIMNVEKATTTMKEILSDRAFDQLIGVTKGFADNVRQLENHFRSLENQYEKISKERQEFSTFAQEQKAELVNIRDAIHSFIADNQRMKNQFEYTLEQYDKTNRDLVQKTAELSTSLKQSLQDNLHQQGNQVRQEIQEITNQFGDTVRNMDSSLSRNFDSSLSRLESSIMKNNQNGVDHQIKQLNDLLHNQLSNNTYTTENLQLAIQQLSEQIQRWNNQRNSAVVYPSQRENR